MPASAVSKRTFQDNVERLQSEASSKKLGAQAHGSSDDNLAFKALVDIELVDGNFAAAREYALMIGCARTLNLVARRSKFDFDKEGGRLLEIAETCIADGDQDSATIVLQIAYRALDNRAQKENFKKSLREWREQYGLRGKKAALLKQFGV